MPPRDDVNLPAHSFSIALLQPQIAPNTGNVARLCVATGTHLHLVRPMGFVLSDREIRRSAMDYWPRLKHTIHDDTRAFFDAISPRRFWLFSSKGTTEHWRAGFGDGDVLIFGSETGGIDEGLLALHARQVLRIPQVQGERCLNLSTCAGIGLYEAFRSVRA